jgi:hypothetical protein
LAAIAPNFEFRIILFLKTGLSLLLIISSALLSAPAAWLSPHQQLCIKLPVCTPRPARQFTGRTTIMSSPAGTDSKIIDGKAIAASIRQELVSSVADFKASSGVTPGLAVVLVGKCQIFLCYAQHLQIKVHFKTDLASLIFAFNTQASVVTLLHMFV